MTIPAPHWPPPESPTSPPGNRPQLPAEPSRSPSLPTPPMADPVPLEQPPAIASDPGEELLDGDDAG
jgi:hypothetical protein